MLHKYGLTTDDVCDLQGKFHFLKFKQAVIDAVSVGTRIDPKCLCRIAQELGCEMETKTLYPKLHILFNASDHRLQRRRGKNGYVYEKKPV